LRLAATIDMPKFPSEAFIYIELRGNEVPFAAKVLAAAGYAWTADT
jgi:hypothetical protein